MSTTVNQNQASQVPSDQGQQSVNVLDTVSAGATAVIQSILYEIMQIYLQIVNDDAEARKSGIELQSTAAKQQAEATEAATSDQAKGLLAVGITTIAGAGAEVGANAVIGRGENSTVTEQSNKVYNEQLTPLKNVENPQNTAGVARIQRGENEVSDMDRENCVKALKRGEFIKQGNGTRPEVIKAAFEHLKANDETAFAAVSSNLNQQIQTHTTQVNTYEQRLSTLQSRRNMFGQTALQVSTAAGQIVQGGFTQAKAEEDAKSIISQTSSSMANSAAQNLDGQMDKMFQQAVAALQTLQRIQDLARSPR